MRAILDTSVVIATDVPPLPGELGISSVTVAELHFGVLIARDPEVAALGAVLVDLRRLTALQRDFDALPVDDAVAASYGRLAAAVVEAGRQPRARTADLLIAATAHAHDARLYTRNAKDLIGLEDLVEILSV